jgi:hypothetical protein
MVKNLFGVQDILFTILTVYLQVLSTRLTPVTKTRFFLKPPNVDKNRLGAFYTFLRKKTVFAFEKLMRAWLTLINFCRYQLTVVAN